MLLKTNPNPNADPRRIFVTYPARAADGLRRHGTQSSLGPIIILAVVCSLTAAAKQRPSHYTCDQFNFKRTIRPEIVRESGTPELV